ncbi:class I SAM-dependent methyltransferase [Winogradskyella sp.]|uniref:class I SAM-dependent methyltransferase n=1 Tax=Winogradskyella sp. TaxID=1883156 RepID=UPI003BA9A900
MDLKKNADRFTGKDYVSLYNRYRPEPPKAILLQGLNYLNVEKAHIILDLGCGTGISTRTLSNFGTKIIGIDPSLEMLVIAEGQTHHKHISYQQGFSNATGIASNSVDMVTCSQSFHWMEPKSTLTEINRILKDNGVLVVYDAIWPPSLSYELEEAYFKLFENVKKLTGELGEVIAHKWDKKKHVTNAENSNYFSYVKESYYHKIETFSKDHFIGLALSQGGLEALLKLGYSEERIGITAFKDYVSSTQKHPETLTYNYRVIFGVKRRQ